MSKPMANFVQKLFKLAAPRPCYGCGCDHWFRDFPIKKDQAPSILPIRRFCTNCKIKHLIQDCLPNLELKGKTSLSMVEIIQSSCHSSLESNPIVPINVITRAQARKQEQSGEESMKPEKSVRAKRNLRYRKNRQKRIAEAKKSAKETSQED